MTCNNLPGETESLEMLSESLLLLGTHQGEWLQVFDVESCEIANAVSIPTGTFNDIEGIAILPETCPLGDLVTRAIELIDDDPIPDVLPSELLRGLPKGYIHDHLNEFITQYT